MVGKDSIPSFWPGSFKDSSKGAWTIGDSTQYSVYTVLATHVCQRLCCLSHYYHFQSVVSISLSLSAISKIANSALSSTCHLRYGWHHECVSWHHVLLCVHVFSSQCHCQISPTYWVKNTEASEWFHVMMLRNSASFNQLVAKKFHRPPASSCVVCMFRAYEHAACSSLVHCPVSSGKRYHMIQQCVSSMREENLPKGIWITYIYIYIECGGVEGANFLFLCPKCYTSVSGCLDKSHLLLKNNLRRRET